MLGVISTSAAPQTKHVLSWKMKVLHVELGVMQEGPFDDVQTNEREKPDISQAEGAAHRSYIKWVFVIC